MLSADELSVDGALEAWRRCLIFRRRTTRIVGAEGLKFAEWQVLRSASRLIRERDDMVSQDDIKRHCGLDNGTVSVALRRMMAAGLVDIGPDAWDWQCRVLVAPKAEALLARLEPVISGLLGHL